MATFIVPVEGLFMYGYIPQSNLCHGASYCERRRTVVSVIAECEQRSSVSSDFERCSHSQLMYVYLWFALENDEWSGLGRLGFVSVIGSRVVLPGNGLVVGRNIVFLLCMTIFLPSLPTYQPRCGDGVVPAFHGSCVVSAGWCLRSFPPRNNYFLFLPTDFVTNQQ